MRLTPSAVADSFGWLKSAAMSDLKSDPERVDLDAWESRLKTLLRSNNSELIKKIECVLAGRGFSAPEEDMNEPIPMELWSQTPENSSENGGSNGINSLESNHEAEQHFNLEIESKGSRLSITSLDSGDDKLYQAKLKKDQKKANRKAFGRASGVVVPTGLMVQTKRIVSSWMFEVFFATAILSNSLLIGVQVHYAAQSIGQPQPPAFFIVEQIYALLFLVELILRVLAEGCPFFWSSPNVMWNYLDVLIVLTSILNLVSEIASMTSLTSDADALMSGNVRIIRILRVTRVIRVVRVVKIVRFIRALRSLVHSIFGTLKVLMWSVLLLLIIIYVFAIVFTDVSTEYISNFEISDSDTAFLKLRFADLERSMQTLFQSISNGLTWGDVADKMHKLSWVWGYLFVVYVAFCCFAVLNVMTGVFCQSAIESAERDQELHVQSVVTSKQQQIEMFMSVFKSIQIERGEVASENLTYMEFEALFNEPHIKSFFQSLDVETSDAWTLFKLMDTSGNGDLDASEFVEGCMRLKGPARSIDVSLLMQEHKRMRKKLLTMDQLLQEVHASLLPESARRFRSKKLSKCFSSQS